MQNYTLKVIEIRKETDDTVTLCFKQPSLKKIKYLAGQYLTLIFRINGRRYIRPYSFSSCPGVDEFLEVTVKRILNGIVSNHINDKVQVGDVIEALPPMGDFTYKNNDPAKEIFLWGIGSGITPLISLLKQLLFQENDVKVNLVYGNRNFESTIFIRQISELKNQFPNRLSVYHFHTKLMITESNPSLVEGRIDREKALTILKDSKALNCSFHYVCGPPGLKESVKFALTQVGIPNNRVFSEEFELIKNPKDFENIHTQNVQVLFDGKMHLIETVKGKSILESALDAGLELPYSCQTGNCSTCLATLITGQAKMIGIKERTDLARDKYLLCCTHPLTDNVYIEI